jgi:hypothetical protein
MIALAFLGTRLGQIVAGGIGLVALFGWFTISQRNAGARHAVERIEKANKQAVARTDRAGAGARDKRVRGNRDPYTID